MTTPRKTLLLAALALLAATALHEARQNSRLREQTQTLQRQGAEYAAETAQLRSDNEALSNRLRGSRSPSLASERLRELLRLRGEVGALRRRLVELEQGVGAAQPKGPRAGGRQPAAPAPFRVQLVLDAPGQDTEPMTNNASGANGETLYVQKTPLLDYSAIRSATVSKDPASGAPQIDVEFSQVGKELFAAITRENLNKRLAIVLNGQLFSAPVIRSEISEGRAQITGLFTEAEASELAARINEAAASQ